jgi:tRNA A58 N-methylase Trm61
VSLLDIHATPPTAGDEADQPPLEILEAGTGHGSLTLHLARAIQAANSNPPPLPKPSQVRNLQDRPARPLSEDEEKNPVAGTEEENHAAEDTVQKQWDEWRAQRRAIVHSVDVSARFSAHAEQIVRGFRRGIYAGNVDFHVGPVENWIADQVRQRRQSGRRQGSGLLASLSYSNREESTTEPFLSHAILDMPSAHQRIPHVAPVLRRDGILAVFVPSITQVGECVQLIRQQNLPFIMEKVVELGTGISSGRQWDVRITVKKSRADPSSWSSTASAEDVDSEASVSGERGEATSLPPSEGESPTIKEDNDYSDDNNVLVCRPKVGLRIVGGGFVGLWRRIEDRKD